MQGRENFNGNLSDHIDETFETHMCYLTLPLLPRHGSILLIVLSASDLNRLIMDYLVIEGYKTAAEEFSKEADIAPPVDFNSIESRMNIREAVQRGDVEEAIERTNDLNPEVCNLTLFYKRAVFVR